MKKSRTGLRRLVAVSLSLPLVAGVTTSAAVAAPGPVVAPKARAAAHFVGGFVAPTDRTSAASTLSAQRGGHRLLLANPTSVDLRTSGFLPAVGDQGQIGSCATWTLAYTMMGYYAAKDHDSGAPFAPLYLYDLKVQGAAPSAGTVPEFNLAELQANGVDTQDDFPQGYYDYRTPVTAAQKANAAKFKVTGWQRLWAGTGQGPAARTLVTDALAAGNPVAVGFNVFSSFTGIHDGSVQTPTSGTSLGGHMVTIVGYDDQGVTIRNQWGTRWGDRGDARLSWQFVEQNTMAAYTMTGVTSPADTGTPYAPTPSISRLSTATGATAGGTPVTVTGANLAGVTAVNVGGVPAAFSLTSVGGANQLLVTTPAHAAGLAPVQLVARGGTSAATAAAAFTYKAPLPTVTQLSATTASTTGGSTVTVTGTALGDVTRVTAGGVAAATVTRTSPTSLSFTVPAHAPGVGDVLLTSPAGSSVATAAGRLTWVAPAAPVVTALSAATGSTAAPTTLTVTGSGLAQAVGVTVAGVGVPFTVVGDTSLRLTVPAHAPGSGPVLVAAKYTKSLASAATAFTWVAPAAPVITSLSATSGSALAVTSVGITGTGLGQVTGASVAGVVVPVTRISDTAVKLAVPAHAPGSGPVVLKAPYTASSSAATFTWVAPPAPALSAASLATVPAGRTTVVTFTGTDLTGTSTVTVGGVAATGVTVLSPTQVRVTVPTRVAGTYPVVVTNALRAASAPFSLQYAA